MTPVFSRTGKEELSAFLERFDKPLVLLDFDGTIAPITRFPSQARLSPGMRETLRKLRARLEVGIISGRSVDNLRAKIPKEIRLLIGNHGLEVAGLSGGDRSRHQEWESRAKRLSRAWKDSLQTHLHTLPRGVWIEDKTYSLTLHYRDTSLEEWEVRENLKHWRRTFPSAIAPAFVAGKRVMNVVLRGAPDKGQTALECMKALGSRGLIFLGDDVTDEAVFQLKRKSIFAARVGRSNESHARYYLRGIPEAECFLRHLLSIEYGSLREPTRRQRP